MTVGFRPCRRDAGLARGRVTLARLGPATLVPTGALVQKRPVVRLCPGYALNFPGR